MFNREVFYRQLDEVYERRDVGAIESFLLNTQQILAQERAEAYPGCEMCITPGMADSLNSGYLKNLLTVQNELLSLYRGVNRFDECLQISAVMKEEMKDLNLLKTEQYAILLINEGTAYRMMQDRERALEDFDASEAILQDLTGGSGMHPHVDPFTLASVYNNRAPVLLQRGAAARAAAGSSGPADADPGRADIEKAICDLRKALEILRKLGRLKQEEAVTLCGIAEACALLGDDEAGERAADEAVALYEEAGQDPHKGAALNVKARFLYKKRDYARAAELFKEAARITKLYYGENKDYQTCMANALRAAKATQRNESAGTVLRDSLK